MEGWPTTRPERPSADAKAFIRIYFEDRRSPILDECFALLPEFVKSNQQIGTLPELPHYAAAKGCHTANMESGVHHRF
jgi:hypothetical protein